MFCSPSQYCQSFFFLPINNVFNFTDKKFMIIWLTLRYSLTSFSELKVLKVELKNLSSLTNAFTRVKHGFVTVIKNGAFYIRLYSYIKFSKIVSKIRKYHNHKPQTTPWHREEEPINHHETPGRQIKQSNHLSLPHQDDCNTRMEIK